MKALTVWQPWATFIVVGGKPYEFRGAHTAKQAKRLIGQRIVIHAGARPIKLGEILDLKRRIKAGESSLYRDRIMPIVQRLIGAVRCQGVLELGAGLGTAVMGEPKSVTELFGGKGHDSDRLNHHLFGLPMLEIERWDEPVPCTGHQGFWDWPHKIKEKRNAAE